jgi:hypothetical protein
MGGDSGTVISGADSAVMLWRSPPLSVGEVKTSLISLEVSDGIGLATKELSLKVTSAPLAKIDLPVASDFEPGVIEFYGSGRDYLNSAIAAGFLNWYLATGSSELALQKGGAASFSYRFLSQGSYTVALTCTDDNGVTSTATKDISIINARPVCVIAAPANNSTFPGNTAINFIGVVNDYEDGLITSDSAVSWASDIDGYLGPDSTFQWPV